MARPSIGGGKEAPGGGVGGWGAYLGGMDGHLGITRRRAAVGLGVAALAGCAPETPRALTAATTEGAVGGASTTRGLEAGRLRWTRETAGALPRLRSLVVLRHGETLAADRFNGGPPLDRPVNIKSASKSVLSALVGVAIARGVLTGADQRVLSVLKADAPARPDPRLETLTVGHLLSMQAGLDRTSGANYGRWVTSPNWVRYALSRPFVDAPGGRMLYSTGSSHLLSAMLTRAAGRSTLALARDWLGGPLGVTIPPWPTDPQGIYFGGNDMLLSPQALARFGELYRLGGRIGDREIIPAGWIEASWTPRTVSPWSGQRYGYGWFLARMGAAGAGDGEVGEGRAVRFGWGYGGQMVYVAPELQMTVVMTSDAGAAREGGHIQSLHRLMAEGLIPAAEAGAG
ncbi:MAG: serine hydrolase [Phenylobacterium sp.]|nr:serine hydrolase [Phenylobacterium sp.]